jgi:CRISPR-associated protein Cas1
VIGRIVEIAGDGRYLSLDRGFLVISHKGKEVGRTSIDDVAALIGNAHGLVYSNNLLVALAERGAPFVLCGANHRPTGILWPVEGHHRQAARMDAQLHASLPMRKRLWKQVVQAKIGMQAAVIGHYGGPEPPLRRLVGKVRSGDPSNIEGQAARLYWGLLLGNHFRRNRDASGINAMLNYGYTVLRAIVARQLMAAGLHPGIPLHHANESNAMRLVDDLMEPFRPLTDAWVRHLVEAGSEQLDPDVKRELALIGTRSLRTTHGISPVTIVAQRLAVSLAQVYESPDSNLEFPDTKSSTLAALWDKPYGSQSLSEEEG